MKIATRIICLFGLPHWPNHEGAKEEFLASLRDEFAGEPVEVELYDNYQELESVMETLALEKRPIVFVVDQFMRMSADKMLAVPVSIFLQFLRHIGLEGKDVSSELRMIFSPCDIYSIKAVPALAEAA